MAGKKELRHEIVLTGEQKYRQALSAIEKNLKGVASSQALLNSEYGKSDTSMAAMSKRQDLLRQKLDEQKKRLEVVRAEYERVSKAQGEGSDRAKDLAKELNYQQAAVNKAETELKQMATAIDKANSRVEQFKAKLKESGITLDKFADKMGNAGQKYTQFVTTTMAAGATATAKLYMDYNDSLASLATLPDAAAYGMEKLSGQILAASDATGAAATELTSATYDAISSGAAVADSVGMVEGAAKAAKAGMSDTGTVIKGTAAAINAFGLETKDATTLYDKFLVAQDAGVLTLNDIASNIGQVTGLAGPLNVSLDDVLASVSSLTLIGVPVSQAFTQIKAVMSAVLKPSAEAAKEAQRLGLEFDSTAIKTKGFGGFIADVQAKTKGSEDSLAKLFGQVEGLSAVMALGTTAAGSYSDILKKLGSSAGTLDSKFATRMASDTQKVNNELNKLKNNAIRLGATLAPVIGSITSGFANLNAWLSSMNEQERQQVVTTMLWVAAIGPMLIGVSKLITAIREIKTGVGFLSTLVGGGGTLALVVAGVSAIVAGVVLLKQHLDSLTGESKIKAAFSNMTIDTGAIDTAMANAEAVTYSLELTTTAKIKLSNDSEDLNAQIVQWLTDGKAETKAQKEEYKKKATEVIQPVYDAIQAAFDEKKATLDEQLANGIINKSTYDARLNELKTTTDATKTSLDTEAQAYITYVMTLVANGTKPTQEQLDKLEELHQKIVQVGQDILDATNAAALAAKASYTATSAGVGTKEDIVVGVKYAQTEIQTKQDSVKARHDQIMADLQKQWEDAGKSKHPVEARLDIEGKMEIENASFEKQKQQLQEQYSKMISDMIDGLAKKYPEQAAKLKEIMKNQNLVEQLTQAVTDVSSDDPEVAAAGQTALDSLYSQMNNGAQNYTGNNLWALTAVDDLKTQVADTLKTGNFSGIFTDFSTALESGATTGLDVTGVGDTLKSLITAYDLADDGKTAGENYITSTAGAIKDSQQTLNDAIVASALAGNEELKKTQGIHSPSTVWKGFGIDLMTGLVDGIKLGDVRVEIQLKLLSKMMKAAGADSIQAMADGAETKRAALVNKFKSIAAQAYKAAMKELHATTSSDPSPSTPTGPAPVGENKSTGDRTSRQIIVQYTGSISEREARKLGLVMGKAAQNSLRGKGQW